MTTFKLLVRVLSMSLCTSWLGEESACLHVGCFQSHKYLNYFMECAADGETKSGFSELHPMAPGPAGGVVLQIQIITLSHPSDGLGSSLWDRSKWCGARSHVSVIWVTSMKFGIVMAVRGQRSQNEENCSQPKDKFKQQNRVISDGSKAHLWDVHMKYNFMLLSYPWQNSEDIFYCCFSFLDALPLWFSIHSKINELLLHLVQRDILCSTQNWQGFQYFTNKQSLQVLRRMALSYYGDHFQQYSQHNFPNTQSVWKWICLYRF